MNCRGPKSWSEPSPLANDTCRTCCRNITNELYKCSSGTCIHRATCLYDQHPGREACGSGNGYPQDDIGFALGCCLTSGDPNPLWPHSRAIAFLNSNAHSYAINSTCFCPSTGCISLDGVRADLMNELARLFPKYSDCGFTILAGTESQAENVLRGVLSHRNGHVLTLDDSPCLRAVICSNEPFNQTKTPLNPTPAPQGQAVCQAQGQVQVHEGCDDYVQFPGRQVLWCRHGNKWEMLFQYRTFNTVDKTLTPFLCGDNETLQICIAKVSSTVDFKGLTVFSEDYGFMLRMASACPKCTNGTEVGVGGPFHVTESEFLLAKINLCDDEDILYATYSILGEVNFCQLEYHATTTCLISGLAARFTILNSSYFVKARTIPDTAINQLSMWRQVFPSQALCPNSSFTQLPPPSTNLCRMRIGIVLDESGSIGSLNFNTAKTALVQFLSSPNLRNNSLISCVTFSSDAKVQFNWTDKADAAIRMTSIPYGDGGSTNTPLGMTRSRNLFPATNDNAELFVILVVTDGQSQTSIPSWPRDDIVPFAVGIQGANYYELLQIARGVPSRVLDLGSFGSFSSNIDLVLGRICDISAAVNLTNATNSSGSLGVTVPVRGLLPNERRYLKVIVNGQEPIDLGLNCTAGLMTAFYSTTWVNPGPSNYDAQVNCNQTATLDPTPQKKPAWVLSYEAKMRRIYGGSGTTGGVTLYVGVIGVNSSAVAAVGQMTLTQATPRTSTVTQTLSLSLPRRRPLLFPTRAPTTKPTMRPTPTPLPLSSSVLNYCRSWAQQDMASARSRQALTEMQNCFRCARTLPLIRPVGLTKSYRNGHVCFHTTAQAQGRSLGWTRRCCYVRDAVGENYIQALPSAIFADSGENNVESFCCTYAGSSSASCSYYRNRRRVEAPASRFLNSALGYCSRTWAFPPPRLASVSGDPYCTTMDGFGYECNFWGEALWTLCGDFIVSATAIPLEPLRKATVLNGVAVVDGPDTVIVSRVFATSQVSVTLNGESFVFSEDNNTAPLMERLTVEWSMNELNVSTIQITSSSGHSVEVEVYPNFLSIRTSLDESCKGKAIGLLGNFDDDKTNDLHPAFEDSALPSNATTEVIFKRFVMSFMISPEISLFTGYNVSRPPGATFRRQSGDYTPTFGSAETLKICPSVCEGRAGCCLDAQVAGVVFATTSVAAAIAVETTVNNTVPANYNWPPQLDFPLEVRAPIGTELTVTINASDTDGVISLTASACEDHVTGVLCGAVTPGNGSATRSFRIQVTIIRNLTITVTARDAKGAETQASFNVVAVLPVRMPFGSKPFVISLLGTGSWGVAEVLQLEGLLTFDLSLAITKNESQGIVILTTSPNDFALSTAAAEDSPLTPVYLRLLMSVSGENVSVAETRRNALFDLKSVALTSFLPALQAIAPDASTIALISRLTVTSSASWHCLHLLWGIAVMIAVALTG